MAELNFPEATEEQIKEGKSLAWLSYFGILFLIPLLVYKDNPFSKYHARQGMVLFFAEVVLGIKIFGNGYKDLGEVGVNLPISIFVGVG